MTDVILQQQAGDDLESLLADPRTDTVTLAVTDGFGRLMGKRFTKAFFVGKTGQRATRMSAAIFSTDFAVRQSPALASLLGGTAFADFDAVPDLATARRAPWAANEVLMLCDETRASGERLPFAPRQMLRSQIEAARARGLTLRMASELEFYLLPDGHGPTRSRQAERQARGGRQDYHLGMTAGAEDTMRDLRTRLGACGLAVEYQKGEAGVGQNEIVLGHDEPLPAADAHLVFKQSVKQICAGRGQAATFLAAVPEEDEGSGGHIHCSLRPADNIDAFVGGVLTHAADLMPFFAPLVVSYKRFRPGSFTPKALTLGADDRACAVRFVEGPSGRRFEFRVPGADMNPYLAYAGLIAAGLAGIDARIEPRTVAPERLPATLPTTLAEATRRFEQSAFARSVFGDPVVEYYAHLFGHETRLFEQAVTDWEVERYWRDA